MDYNKIMKELSEYIRIQEEATEKANELKETLKKYMEDNHIETLSGTEHKATYKAVNASRIDSKKLKEDLPDVYIKYARESVTMRFTFK